MSDPFLDLSLAPSQIPSRLTEKQISQAGRHGTSGGINGTPSPGQSAGNISTYLRYDPHKPRKIQVNYGVREPLEVSRHEYLMLNVRGGDGGNGGVGSNGHNGRSGSDGEDATRYSPGTDGGDGEDGGDAGSGTHGANAGHGGKVSIKLGEDDLDLLLAANWNVSGGMGGAAGRHGIAGTGGAGGRGGSSYSWTEYETETYTTEEGNTATREVPVHKRQPGGRNGSRGRDGYQPTSPLYPGSDGRNGNTNISIEHENGTKRSYDNRYHLVVESFEVSDENQDGVNEPGEYLIVKNIVVHNKGPMPSPSGNLIKVVIRNSPWLEPETTAPLNLPNSILPKGKATIPGELRAFIRHERTQRKSGEQLLASETVTLLAYSERLRREVPEFSGGVPIIVQYPLQLIEPAYLDCMTKADELQTSWIVENISTRGYGRASDTQRTSRTRFIDQTKSFVLGSTAAGDNIFVTEIRNSRPKSELSISESFTVASETKVFSTGSFRLELYLSDPHNPKEIREIMNYEFKVQVSEPYEYKESSQFLLVVNASTQNEGILEMKAFVRSKLHLGIDIFNLSLTGTLMDKETKQSVLLRYAGKSIIVTGNTFRYFGPSRRYNWDLMDPQEVLFLSMNHTGFLFCEVLDAEANKALTKWTRLLSYAIGPDDDTVGTLRIHKDRNKLIRSLHNDPHAGSFSLEQKNQYLLKRNFRILRRIFQGTTDRRLKRGSKSLTRKLNYQMPMRRFVVSTEKRLGEAQEPEEDAEERPNFLTGLFRKKSKDGEEVEQKSPKRAPSTGIIFVAEGLSRTATCMVSHSPLIDNLNAITPQQTIMMIASIPFHNLALIFWNTIRSMSRRGLSAEAFYRNMDGFEPRPDSSIEKDDFDDVSEMMITYDVCIAVAWAVERVLDCEVQQLSAQSRQMLDTIRKKNMHIHTQRIAKFFEAVHDDSISASDEAIGLAIQVLSSLNASLRPNSHIGSLKRLPGLSDRRVRLRRSLNKHKTSVLLFMAPPDKTKELQKRISKSTKLLSEAIRNNRNVPRTEQSHIKERLAAYNDGYASGYTDISAGEHGSAYMGPNEFEAYKTAYRKLLHKQQHDMSYAREQIRAMREKVFRTDDYVALKDFK